MPYNDTQIFEWADAGGISPFQHDNINPASIDLRLGAQWVDFEYPAKLIFATHMILYPRTLRVELHNTLCRWLPDGYAWRRPTALLAITWESVCMPDNVAGEVKLKTTPTRKGLGHPIADWVDPGYCGHLTLMLHAVKQIELRWQDKVCQLVMWPMDKAAAKPYRDTGHYMNQQWPTLAWDEEKRYVR